MKLIRPLGDRVIIRDVEEKEKSAGGIIIPQTAKDLPQEGVVLAVGDGRYLENGVKVPLTVKPGDTVVFGKFAGNEITVDEEKVRLLREEEIHSIVFAPADEQERQYLIDQGAAEIGRVFDEKPAEAPPESAA